MKHFLCFSHHILSQLKEFPHSHSEKLQTMKYNLLLYQGMISFLKGIIAKNKSTETPRDRAVNWIHGDCFYGWTVLKTMFLIVLPWRRRSRGPEYSHRDLFWLCMRNVWMLQTGWEIGDWHKVWTNSVVCRVNNWRLETIQAVQHLNMSKKVFSHSVKDSIAGV